MESGETEATKAERFISRLQVQVLASRRQQLGKDWCLDLCSPFWRLYVNDRSGAYVHHGDRRISLAENVAWIIPAWMHFQTTLQRPCTQDFIHFQVTGQIAKFLESTVTAPQKLAMGRVTSVTVHQWRSGLGSPDLASGCWAAATAYAALAGILSNCTPSQQQEGLLGLGENSEIQPAIDLIERQPDTPPANAQLAETCRMSEDHFIRKFRKAAGITPAEYGRHHRVLLAAELLAGSSRTIEDISESTGFTDRFHFSRRFKSQLGLPPATYRRMHRLDLPLGSV